MTIRTGSVTYSCPRTLKTLAIAVSGTARPEIISRSHASSSRWMLASVPWSPAAAKAQAVSATTTAVTAASRTGATTSAGSARPAARPAQPGHGAPRPHRARPSVRRMNSTSAGRDWKESALSAAPASTGDAPGAKANR